MILHSFFKFSACIQRYEASQRNPTRLGLTICMINFFLWMVFLLLTVANFRCSRKIVHQSEHEINFDFHTPSTFITQKTENSGNLLSIGAPKNETFRVLQRFFFFSFSSLNLRADEPDSVKRFCQLVSLSDSF